MYNSSSSWPRYKCSLLPLLAPQDKPLELKSPTPENLYSPPPPHRQTQPDPTNPLSHLATNVLRTALPTFLKLFTILCTLYLIFRTAYLLRIKKTQAKAIRRKNRPNPNSDESNVRRKTTALAAAKHRPKPAVFDTANNGGSCSSAEYTGAVSEPIMKTRTLRTLPPITIFIKHHHTNSTPCKKPNLPSNPTPATKSSPTT